MKKGLRWMIYLTTFAFLGWTPICAQNPRQWNEAVLRAVVENIGSAKEMNAVKIGYFGRKGESKVDFSDGFKIINEAISKETAGGKRWFILQNVRGAGVFQIGAVSDQEGFDSYNAIFSEAPKASANGATPILFLSINEFFSTATYRFNSLGLQQDPRTKETLFKAWDAYLRLDRSQLKGNFPEPDFARAFSAIGAEKEAKVMVVKAIADPSVPRSYALLSAGAQVIAADEPLKAIGFLRDAKAFLPQQTRRVDGEVKTELDVNEAARFYDRLVELLEKQNQLPQAIIEQRERIVKTGGGRGKLWVLLGKVGDEAGQKSVIAELQSPELKARETLRAVRILGENKGTETAQLAATQKTVRELLQSLLLPTRKLADDEQMETRLLLAQNLWRSGELDAAAKIAVMEKPAALPGNHRNLWNNLERLQKSLAKALEDEAKKKANEKAAQPVPALPVEN